RFSFTTRSAQCVYWKNQFADNCRKKHWRNS
ncbi:UvrABC system protein A, partial [Haemophilus influenzae]